MAVRIPQIKGDCPFDVADYQRAWNFLEFLDVFGEAKFLGPDPWDSDAVKALKKEFLELDMERSGPLSYSIWLESRWTGASSQAIYWRLVREKQLAN